MKGTMLNMVVLSQVLWVSVLCEGFKGDYWLSTRLQLNIAFSTLWALFRPFKSFFLRQLYYSSLWSMIYQTYIIKGGFRLMRLTLEHPSKNLPQLFFVS